MSTRSQLAALAGARGWLVQNLVQRIDIMPGEDASRYIRGDDRITVYWSAVGGIKQAYRNTDPEMVAQAPRKLAVAAWLDSEESGVSDE